MTEDERDKQDGHMDWLRWPPTPRMQIVLVALVFGLINLVLLAVWVIALISTR